MLSRTTRDRTFEKRKADWRKQNKKAGVPAAVAHDLAEKLPPTTFFDFLWPASCLRVATWPRRLAGLRHRVPQQTADLLRPQLIGDGRAWL
jgi:hypothetical protein